MNLTFPIADWLFGTSDLNRGVIGHLLNGYDTRYLKKICVARRSRRIKRPQSRLEIFDRALVAMKRGPRSHAQ